MPVNRKVKICKNIFLSRVSTQSGSESVLVLLNSPDQTSGQPLNSARRFVSFSAETDYRHFYWSVLLPLLSYCINFFCKQIFVFLHHILYHSIVETLSTPEFPRNFLHISDPVHRDTKNRNQNLYHPTISIEEVRELR